MNLCLEISQLSTLFANGKKSQLLLWVNFHTSLRQIMFQRNIFTLFNGAQKLIDFQIAAKTETALGNFSATFPNTHRPVTAGRKAVRCFVMICERR